MPRHALLIGNYQYTHAPKLFKCDRDAKFLGQELISLGFECRVRENLRRDTAETEFREWRDSLPRKCIALFDFSGIIRASGFRVFFHLSDTIALYFYQYNIMILGLSYKVSTIWGYHQ